LGFIPEARAFFSFGPRNIMAKQQRKNAPQEYEHASASDTLPYPWPQEYRVEQVATTAEHLLAIPGWVPVERVVRVAQELIELADDADIVIDGSLLGDETEGARYALLAARLIEAYELVLHERATGPTNRG
jgi:hypothetical protein